MDAPTHAKRISARHIRGILTASVLAFGAMLGAVSSGIAENAPSTCAAFQARPGETLIWVRPTGAAAHATVAIGDATVNTAVVHVEIGSDAEPSLIVLDALQPTIWHFSGSVDRVRVVATQSADWKLPVQRPVAVAVSGLDADRVRFVADPDCLRRSATGDYSGLPYLGTAKPLFNADTVFVVKAFAIARLSLPGMRIDAKSTGLPTLPPPASGAARWLWLDFWQQEVVIVDPRSLLSLRPASSYEWLPGPRGLAQMLVAGLLQVEPIETFTDAQLSQLSERSRRFAAIILKSAGFGLRIKQPITLPKGLCGSLAFVFVAKREIGQDFGDRCHSEIVFD